MLLHKVLSVVQVIAYLSRLPAKLENHFKYIHLQKHIIFVDSLRLSAPSA